MPKLLTSAQLEALASRPKVKRVAVENFLNSVSLNYAPPYGARGNADASLHQDAKLYGWNAPTQKAIRDGLRLIFNNEDQDENEDE